MSYAHARVAKPACVKDFFFFCGVCVCFYLGLSCCQYIKKCLQINKGHPRTELDVASVAILELAFKPG